MAVKKTSSETEIKIAPIEIKTVHIRLDGDSPLIMHKWSEKAKKMILDKEQKKSSSKKHDIKLPVKDFIESMYWLDGEPDLTDADTDEECERRFADAIASGKARWGFPATAFKAAAVSSAYRAELVKNKVTMNGAFHIPCELVEIKGCVPELREDMVKLQGTAADIRYRGEFKNWYAEFDVQYNSGVISLEQLISYFNLGGFSCGVGEWRIEKGGTSGAFHVHAGK